MSTPTADGVPVEELVPPGPLAAYMDEHVPWGRGEPVTVTRLGLGRSNLTFAVERQGRRWVLRRPPRGDLPATAHDMMREHRVLSALAGTPVRAPVPVSACADPDVIGVPFYLMEEVGGVVIRERLPVSYGEADHARLSDELVDALAELHAVDYGAQGLADLGRPGGYTARQVRRWAGQWEVMATRSLPDIETTREWLAAAAPTEHVTAIVHGDYKLDNAMFTPESPARLLAILDWEMATLGDPLADLGYLLVCWPEPGEELIPGIPQPVQGPAFRRRHELVERYAERTGTHVADLTFYRVLALWKLAILCEGLFKRYLAGKADGAWYAVLEVGVPQMAARARSWWELQA